MDKSLPIGFSDFERIISSNSYYVDKTSFIPKYLGSTIEKDTAVNLFTRPRRFGKSLFLSVLKSFLTPNYKDFNDLSSHIALFKDLDVYKDQEFCNRYMGKFPVVSISFKGAGTSTSYENSLRRILLRFSELADTLEFLNQYDLAEEDSDFLKLLKQAKTNANIKLDITILLSTICQIIFKYTKIKPIVLIDEYDVPLAKSFQTDYYQDFRQDYSDCLGNALKDCDYVHKAFITGCLRVTKESIFTGFNNFKVNSLTTFTDGSLFGFTQKEVEQMLKFYNLTEKADIFKTWYDGYRIAEEEIYCPWDVINYVSDCKSNADSYPLSYWNNSASSEILRNIFEKSPDQYVKEFPKLLEFKDIEVNLNEGLSYQEMAVSKNANQFWTLLFSTGYLTLAKSYNPNTKSSLKIPNLCVKKCFETLATWCFNSDNKSYQSTKNKLIEAFLKADDLLISQILNKLLLIAISYRDFSKNLDKEGYYQAFLNGVFSEGIEQDIYSYAPNYELGLGYADICIVKRENGDVTKAAIIELKHSKNIDTLNEDSKKGLKQIFDKKYHLGLFEKHDTLKSISCIGLAFNGKQCAVACKKATVNN